MRAVMTDTPPTELDPVIVTGQRRQANGSFPPASGSGGYSEPPEGPVPIEVEEGEEPTLPRNPCADPQTALPWNADAAGAGSVEKFLQKAAFLGGPDAPNGSPVLTHREFARALERNADGFRSGYFDVKRDN